jgi:CBS domain-containing protein
MIGMSYLVKYYMRKEVPTCGNRSSVSEAAKVMEKTGRGFLIVVKDGSPAGIVTERDFVNKIIAHDLDPKKVLVGEIMSSPLITVDPDEDLLVASEIMQKHNIRRLPVVKEGTIYGVITSTDISRHCVDYVNKFKDMLRWAVPLEL